MEYPGNNYSVIHSTFRNIDALVEDKTLASVNGEHHQQGREHNSQNQNNHPPSPFHPFSHQEQHQQHSLHSPSRGVHNQLPPPLDPVETRVTR